MTQDESLASPEVGMLTIFDQDAYVLFDPSAIHSFMSHSFALHIGNKPSPLDAVMIVHNPLGNSMACEKVYKDCVVKIGEHELLANLVPLQLQGLDAILGMDWLSRHYASVDCFKKMVEFKRPGEPKFYFQGIRHALSSCLISHIAAKKMLRKGCRAFLAHVIDTNSKELKLEDIPIACEFKNVFPKDLPGLLPDREVEFSINVVPGTAPISHTL